ncbi:MAG TPA: hypothetical protein VND66_02950 [Acidobacteriaceae bacterium]|nr:hypothetical protein [Acidobacteriaceae bacterium]
MPHDLEETQQNGRPAVIQLLTEISHLEQQQAAELQKQGELARQRTDTTSNLVAYSSQTAENAEKQTGFAQERTALTREQTRLSTRTTELASVRTELAQERTRFAEDRTRLAVHRTEMARRRTAHAEWRTRLAERRTGLARERTVHTITRTRFAMQRTTLAKGRTCLAMIRTGLALLTAALVFMRYFGFSPWTIFDVALLSCSLGFLYFGAMGYHRTRNLEKEMAVLLTEAIPSIMAKNAYESAQALDSRFSETQAIK